MDRESKCQRETDKKDATRVLEVCIMILYFTNYDKTLLGTILSLLERVRLRDSIPCLIALGTTHLCMVSYRKDRRGE